MALAAAAALVAVAWLAQGGGPVREAARVGGTAVELPPAAPAAPAAPPPAPGTGGDSRPDDVHPARLAAWAAPRAAATGVPAPALRAYAAAALRTRGASPGCGLTWTLLAGIGAVESDHGRYGGRVLGADGRSSAPLVGVPLDGGPGVALVRDTDGGRLDGDAVLDRAVGPLQVLPSTWRGVASDGDGDGAADPQDLDDAALGAARYLCSAGQDLTSGQGWWTAVLTYNRDSAYAARVHGAADAYGRAAP